MLEKYDDFKSLQKGDILLVKWSKFFVKHHKGSSEKMLYNVVEHKKLQEEIILKMPQNHYFNYRCKCIEKSSQAKEVYLIAD